MACLLIILVIYTMLFIRLSPFLILTEGIAQRIPVYLFLPVLTSTKGNKISVYLSIPISVFSSSVLLSLSFSSICARSHAALQMEPECQCSSHWPAPAGRAPLQPMRAEQRPVGGATSHPPLPAARSVKTTDCDLMIADRGGEQSIVGRAASSE